MTDAPFVLKDRATLQRACATLTVAQSPALPALQAAADGVIALVGISGTRTKWPERLLAKARRPVLVIVGDDHEPERASTPPEGWRCAKLLRAWAKRAIAHGAGGEAGHYRLAVEAALVSGRAVLIETNSTIAPQWQRFLSPVPTLLIIPRNGGAHPVMPPRSAMQ